MNTLSTPPLSPSVVQQLHALNIFTVHDLQQVGAAKAFAWLKASGLTVTFTVLWQLGALCHCVPVRQLDNEAKKALQDAYKALPPIRLPAPEAEQHRHMQHALAQAQQAFDRGEIPIGAVVVHQGQVIAAAHNECVQQHFVGAHAEMLALQRAGQVLGTYRLSKCDVYVTVEPCPMCCGALLQSRVQRVFYGATEPKMGAVKSQINLHHHRQLNPHTAFFGAILEEDCRLLMQKFFISKR